MPSCWGVLSKSPANCHMSCSTTRHNSGAPRLMNSNRRRTCATCLTQNFEEIEAPLIHSAESLPCFVRCHLAKLCRALRSRIAHISCKVGISLPPLGIITYSALNPRPESGRSGLCGHLFGGARRAVVLVRVGLGLLVGLRGLGDAGNETLDQLDGTLHGAAGVGADVFVGREGDHEAEDASGGIAGSDGDGRGCCIVVLICRVHVFLFVSGSSPFHQKARRLRAASGSGLQMAPLVPAPARKPRGEGRRLLTSAAGGGGPKGSPVAMDLVQILLVSRQYCHEAGFVRRRNSLKREMGI